MKTNEQIAQEGRKSVEELLHCDFSLGAKNKIESFFLVALREVQPSEPNPLLVNEGENIDQEQIFLQDIGSYIRVSRQITKRPIEEILGTIAHDISGRISGVEGFVPRSNGFYEIEQREIDRERDRAEGGESDVGCND